MQEVIEIFKQITKIPHCSKNTTKLQKFIIDFAKKYDYEVLVDKAGNILARYENPLFCLQSHIDMVCIGKAPQIEIIQKDGYLMAKDSSLGADNGIGVAIMLYFISKKENLEFLFTNDEEIGLIGAKNLELSIKSKYLLNLDSENDSTLIIGSAGGVDAKVKYPKKTTIVYGTKGELIIDNLPGGHSGIDIKRPSAIVELIKRINTIAYIKGGEKTNSIAKFAKSIEVFDGDEEIEVYDKEYVKFLKNLPHGIIEYDFEYDVVSKSINFALIDGFESIFSLRANSKKKLEELKEYFKLKAKYVTFENEYPAWAPERNEFTNLVKKVTNTKECVIHAGLECGVLKEKFPNVKFASYGVNIHNPHTIDEKVEITSINKVTTNLVNLIKLLKKGDQ